MLQLLLSLSVSVSCSAFTAFICVSMFARTCRRYKDDGIKFGTVYVSVAAVWAICLALSLLPCLCGAHFFRFLALLVRTSFQHVACQPHGVHTPDECTQQQRRCTRLTVCRQTTALTIDTNRCLLPCTAACTGHPPSDAHVAVHGAAVCDDYRRVRRLHRTRGVRRCHGAQHLLQRGPLLPHL